MVLDALVHKKNLVIERQKQYQASHKPIWLRPARSRLYIGLYNATFAVGMAGVAYSAYSLIRGKPT
ncbi:hypothetical protein FA95DRAFT_1600834 [Auriscalpium vulgare]|uniref:Uncharacterized protein n=1 Tax=Auriscalpium vulgare TaxID=40419 RepID=A0ACB8SCW7_9AGAM|nr:hypothetical protein FA95DRAFT_1600834 [Auriscalpium vulgare]